MKELNKYPALLVTVLAISIATTNATPVYSGGSEGPGLIKRIKLSAKELAKRHRRGREYVRDNEVVKETARDLAISTLTAGLGATGEVLDAKQLKDIKAVIEVGNAIDQELERSAHTMTNGVDFKTVNDATRTGLELFVAAAGGPVASYTTDVLKVTAAATTAYVYGFSVAD